MPAAIAAILLFVSAASFVYSASNILCAAFNHESILRSPRYRPWVRRAYWTGFISIWLFHLIVAASAIMGIMNQQLIVVASASIWPTGLIFLGSSLALWGTFQNWGGIITRAITVADQPERTPQHQVPDTEERPPFA